MKTWSNSHFKSAEERTGQRNPPLCVSSNRILRR